MSRFSTKLAEALKTKLGPDIGYLHPDRFAGDVGSTTFIYADGEMYYSRDTFDTHSDIIHNDGKLYDEIDNTMAQARDIDEDWDMGMHEAAEKLGWLLGRIGNYHYEKADTTLHVASFWTESRDVLNQHLKPCLTKLLQDKLIDGNTFVSFPREFMSLQEVGDFSGTELSPEEQEELAQLRKLHLMGPEEKKAVMRRYGYTGGQKHPWQSAAEKAGVAGPGQRFWAMASEEKQAQMTHAHIHPNVFYKEPGAVPFIYSEDGEIIYGRMEDPHLRLVRKFDPVFYDNTMDLDVTLYSSAEDQGWLLGRVGTQTEETAQELKSDIPIGAKIATFWTQSRRLLKRALRPCLERLLADGVIDENAFVSYPDVAMPLSKLVHISAKLSPEQEQKQEQLRKLHLMQAGEKKQALAKMGYTGSQKHPWQQELEKLQLLTPGQRYWAPTSEELDQS